MTRRLIYTVFSVLVLSSCTYDIKQDGVYGGEASSVANVPYSVTGLDIVLEADPMLDQDAMVLGVLCSAHHYKMRLSDDLSKTMTALDRNAALDHAEAADIRVRALSSRATLKCVFESAMSGKCQADVTLNGSIVRRLSGKEVPFTIAKTSVHMTSGCEGAVDALREASRAVVMDVADEVRGYDH